MSKLLEPFTNFLRSIGIDPLLFGMFVLLLFIIYERKDYKNWKEQSRQKKQVLMWTVIIFLLALTVWTIDKLGIRSL